MQSRSPVRFLPKTLSLCFLLLCGLQFPVNANAGAQQLLDYVIFEDCPMKGGNLYSETKSSGNSWVKNLSGKLPVASDPAYTPGSSIELSYVSASGGVWQAKLLHRPIRGQDEWDNGVFTQAKASPFKKPELIQLRVLCSEADLTALPQVSLLLSDNQKSAPVALEKFLSRTDTAGWRQAKIPLNEFKGVSVVVAEQVKGLLFEQGAVDGKEHEVYLDNLDVRPAESPTLYSGGKAEIVSKQGFERHIDISWKPQSNEGIYGTIIERSTDGAHFRPVGFKPRYLHRFADYIGDEAGTYFYRICFLGYDGKRSDYSPVEQASSRMMNDGELLEMVQEACARYYWEGAEENSGMILESIPGDSHMVATGASGFGIFSLVVSAARNFVPRAEVAQRMLKILNYLEHTDRFHGVFAHYNDGRTGHPVLFFGPDDNGGDLVETSFLMHGLLTARQFFDKDDPSESAIRQKITKLWEEVEWNWYRQKADSKYLYWHWSPDKEWKINHRLIGWNESMITYLLGIASPKHSIPKEMYYSGFASQERLAQEYRGDGPGKMYTNGETYFGQRLPVGGFSGGPIFFTHYNFLGMDPRGLRDRYTDYFENSKAIAQINLRYCEENPMHRSGYGASAWGLTASDGPWSYNPDEPRKDGDKGKITPTGAIASMPYLPDQSIAALKNYYRNYGSFLWGEYGFRDAFSIDENWVNDLYMGLNQGPMVVMIENYRSGLPWKLFGSNPEIRTMRSKLFEH